MKIFTILWLLIMCSFHQIYASLQIDVGNHILLPNTPDQEITLYVTGDQQVTGFNLRAQIGDGLGGQVEPVFQGISITQSLWSIYDTVIIGGPISAAEQYIQSSVVMTTSEQSVLSNGELLTLLVDTTGIKEGNFELKLKETDIQVSSSFIGLPENQITPEIDTTITNGWIGIRSSNPDGDFNHDNHVDLVDYFFLARYYLEPNTPVDCLKSFDFNNDQIIDAYDLSVFVSLWLK